MRTIIHPTEAAELRLLLRRLLVAMLHEVSPGPQLTANFKFSIVEIYSTNIWQLLHAHYECFALSVSVHYVFGECAMRCATIYSFDYIITIHFKVNLLNFLFFSFQNVKSSVMRAHSCH